MDNLKRRGIPQLLINRKYAKFNYICTDAASSISEGLDRIIADGEKKIALVSRLPDAGAAFIPERLIAFYEQCFIRNLQIPEKWIFKRDFRWDKLFSVINQISRKIFSFRRKIC